jgi:hypothetical protein
MQSPADLDLAHRVLNTIRSHSTVKQKDAFALRMWAVQCTRMRPLEDIANEIIDRRMDQSMNKSVCTVLDVTQHASAHPHA